ncbi:hypothetical protein F5Y19DRAFT_437034, partial [Xylariaceae sp. FL1651]
MGEYVSKTAIIYISPQSPIASLQLHLTYQFISMKFLQVIASTQLGFAWGLPAGLENRQWPPTPYNPCMDALWDTPLCCTQDILGHDIQCYYPSQAPYSAEDFRDICAWSGLNARCCANSPINPVNLCVTPLGL